MIERLCVVVAQAEELSEAEQELLAEAWEQVLEELEEREWMHWCASQAGNASSRN